VQIGSGSARLDVTLVIVATTVLSGFWVYTRRHLDDDRQFEVNERSAAGNFRLTIPSRAILAQSSSFLDLLSGLATLTSARLHVCAARLLQVG
jgi:hypothetical protein